MGLIFRVIYVLLFLISTFWVTTFHPELPKPAVFESQDFKVAQIDTNTPEDTKPSGTLQVTDTTLTSTQERPEPVIYNLSPESVMSDSNNWIFQQNQPKSSNTKVTVNTPITKPVEKTITPAKPQKTFTDIVNESQKNPEKDLTLEEIKIVVDALSGRSNANQTEPKTTSTNTSKQMTESEEIIAWNIWRANFQNTVMKNSGNIPAPIGTAFLYSCVVDKYGNISNINVWSTNPSYTPMAKQYIKPAITGMQRKPVVKFPTGTKRTTVVAEGSFIMSNVDRYATPNYYSDYERVRVQK